MCAKCKITVTCAVEQEKMLCEGVERVNGLY